MAHIITTSHCSFRAARGRDKKASGDVSSTATNPSNAVASPSQQTAGAQTGNASGAATQTTKPGINAASAQTAVSQTAVGADRPAGAQTQTKAETSVTGAAGAAPPQTAAARSGDKEPKKDTSQLGGLYAQPKPKPEPNFTLPRIERRKLSNGLDVLIVQQHELPVVSMNLVLKTGAAADPQDRAGLASLTAALIDEGTKTRSSLDISNALAAIGARLSTGADWDSTGARPVTQAELEYAKQAIVRGFPRSFETPEQISARLEPVVLYGLPDDYFNNYIQSVRRVSLSDVTGVAERYLDPSKMAILVVGDRRVIEPGLRSLEDIGQTITLVDTEGRIVSGDGATSDGGASGARP